MKYRLGIDVGGTNTDAVILDTKSKVIAGVKVSTTDPVVQGIENAVAEVLKSSAVSPSEIRHAMLGTTHATNAIVQRRGLAKVGVLRLSAPSGSSIPPYTDWPDDIVQTLGGVYRIVKGGYEYNGVPIAATDENEIRTAVREMKSAGIEALAISGAFSLVNSEQEENAAEISREVLGKDFPVAVSHQIGSIGLVERENAAILNAAIQRMAEEAYGSFENVLERHGIDAELFITQNDGTLMNITYAKQYPVLTIASGPTNSLRGAAFLSGVKDAIVIDVGGTTTDLGVLKAGFPRESGAAVEIGGVRTNFRMPDLVSIGLGGGSIVRTENQEITVGPDSVGFRIREEALSFGGSKMTATDVVIAGDGIDIEGAKAGTKIDGKTQEAVTAKIKSMLEEVVDKGKTVLGDTTVVAVGGGSILVPSVLAGASEVIKPDHFEVANAIGAAISQVSGQVDGVFDVAGKGRDNVIAEVKAMAVRNAEDAGAQPGTIEIVELDEIPLAYLPSNAVRFRAKAVGALNTENLRGGKE
jgi:N-methylhydantoinase A/oxoprolinase/acetone carboxylase beta subunit